MYARWLRVWPLPKKGAIAGLAAGLALAGAAGATTAVATTGDSLDLPAPKVLAPVKVTSSYLGRFLLNEVPRKSRLISAQLDIGIPEEAGNWIYGELSLRFDEASGQPANLSLAVYEFEYHAATHSLSAELIPAATVTDEHPLGVVAGHISFTVPPKAIGLDQKGKQLNILTAAWTFNGRGPYGIKFKRISADEPSPVPLPKAKIGK